MDTKVEMEMVKTNFFSKLKDSKLNFYKILIIMDAIPEHFDFSLKDFDTFMLSIGKRDGSEYDPQDKSSMTEVEYFKYWQQYNLLRVSMGFHESKRTE